MPSSESPHMVGKAVDASGTCAIQPSHAPPRLMRGIGKRRQEGRRPLEQPHVAQQAHIAALSALAPATGAPCMPTAGMRGSPAARRAPPGKPASPHPPTAAPRPRPRTCQHRPSRRTQRTLPSRTGAARPLRAVRAVLAPTAAASRCCWRAPCRAVTPRLSTAAWLVQAGGSRRAACRPVCTGDVRSLSAALLRGLGG